MSVNFTCELSNGEIVNDEFCLGIQTSNNVILTLFRNWLSMILNLYQTNIVSSKYRIN
jgi:hypothetical protein